MFKGSGRQTFESLIPTIDGIPGRYSTVTAKFDDDINLYTSVIPSAFIEDITEMLKFQGKQLETVKEKLQNLTDIKRRSSKVHRFSHKP